MAEAPSALYDLHKIPDRILEYLLTEANKPGRADDQYRIERVVSARAHLVSACNILNDLRIYDAGDDGCTFGEDCCTECTRKEDCQKRAEVYNRLLGGWRLLPPEGVV